MEKRKDNRQTIRKQREQMREPTHAITHANRVFLPYFVAFCRNFLTEKHKKYQPQTCVSD